MRLREVQKVIENNLPQLYDVKFEYVNSSGYKTKNYSDVFLSVINIEKLGFIDTQYNTLIQHNLLVNSSKSDSVIFSQEKRETTVSWAVSLLYHFYFVLNTTQTGLSAAISVLL